MDKNVISELKCLSLSINNFQKFYKTLHNTTHIEFDNKTFDFIHLDCYDVVSSMHSSLIEVLDDVVVQGFGASGICSTYEANFDNYFDTLERLNYLEGVLCTNHRVNKNIINRLEPTMLSNEQLDRIQNSIEIKVMPFDVNVLKSICKSPHLLHSISSSEFEIIMAELYSQLGFITEHTQLTRDGGKDIILTQKSLIGNDFIYYVECKHFSPNRPVGVGIIRQFAGTILGERLNGGIIATSSYFSKYAQDHILKNNLNCLIKLHDHEHILKLLSTLTK